MTSPRGSRPGTPPCPPESSCCGRSNVLSCSIQPPSIPVTASCCARACASSEIPLRRSAPGRAEKPGYGASVRSVSSTLSSRPTSVKTARSTEIGPLDSASRSGEKLRSTIRSAIPCFILSHFEATVEASYSVRFKGALIAHGKRHRESDERGGVGAKVPRTEAGLQRDGGKLTLSPSAFGSHEQSQVARRRQPGQRLRRVPREHHDDLLAHLQHVSERRERINVRDAQPARKHGRLAADRRPPLELGSARDAALGLENVEGIW